MPNKRTWSVLNKHVYNISSTLSSTEGPTTPGLNIYSQKSTAIMPELCFIYWWHDDDTYNVINTLWRLLDCLKYKYIKICPVIQWRVVEPKYEGNWSLNIRLRHCCPNHFWSAYIESIRTTTGVRLRSEAWDWLE
jgi:hypothetical protein